VRTTDWDYAARRNTCIIEGEKAADLAKDGLVKEALVHFENAIKTFPNNVGPLLDRAGTSVVHYNRLSTNHLIIATYLTISDFYSCILDCEQAEYVMSQDLAENKDHKAEIFAAYDLIRTSREDDY